MKRTFGSLSLVALLGLALAASANDDANMKKSDGVKRDKQAMTERGPKGDQMKLVHKMHHANLMEIEMGGLAQRNGGSESVKRYGQMLVDDHKKADVDLLNIASKMGISMAEPGKPAGRSDMMHDKKDKMEKMEKMEKMDQPDAKTPPREMNDNARSGNLRGSGSDAMDDKRPGMNFDGEMHGHRMMMKDLQDVKGPEFDQKFLALMVRDHQKDIDEAKRARAKMQDGDELAKLIDQQLPVLQKHLQTAQSQMKNAKQ